jgi:hypothetical protein
MYLVSEIAMKICSRALGLGLGCSSEVAESRRKAVGKAINQ